MHRIFTNDIVVSLDPHRQSCTSIISVESVTPQYASLGSVFSLLYFPKWKYVWPTAAASLTFRQS